MAAGAWSAALAPVGDGPPVRPVKGQILELRVRGGDGRARSSASCARRAATSCRAATAAWCSARRSRSRASTRPSRPTACYRLLEAAWEVLPEVGELELVRRRRGPAAGHAGQRRRSSGPGELDGLIWATGHWRNGVLLAPLTGDAVADLLAERRSPTAFARDDRRDAERRAHASSSTARHGRVGGRWRRARPTAAGVAVAVDGEVVPRGEWASTELRDGQQRRGRCTRCRAADGLSRSRSPVASSSRA